MIELINKCYNKNMHKKGFTLIELLLVISILGIMATLISGNFIKSLEKGRDAQRKSDLSTIQKGLELYYEDNLSYPTSLTFGSSLCHPSGCDAKMYIKKVPTDPKSSCSYYYVHTSSPERYEIYSTIENTQDSGENVNQGGYTGTDCGCGTCKYKITSPNTP